jgi:hypothetical protein
MSRVTNVILTAHVGPQNRPDEEIVSVNRFLEADQGAEAVSSRRSQITPVATSIWSVEFTSPPSTTLAQT